MAESIIPSIADFDTITIGHNFSVHATEGQSTPMLLRGQKGNHRQFEVEFRYSHNRLSAVNPDVYEQEPDVAYVDHISVTEGKGLGSAAMKFWVEHLKKRGIYTARTAIINPRMIGVVEKLRRLDIIHDAAYLIEAGTEPIPMPLTPTMQFSDDRVSAQRASDYLEGVDERRQLYELAGDLEGAATDPAAFGAIDCALYFPDRRTVVEV